MVDTHRSILKTIQKRLVIFVNNLFRIVHSSIKEFFKDQCLIRAASLSFSTLLAGVPLSAFILSLFAAFGGFEGALEDLKTFTVDMLMPTRQDDLIILIDEFVANSSALGIVGLSIFAVTSINLLNTITVNMNALWGSKQSNNFLGKFTTYTSVLIFGTLLIGVSFTIRSVIEPIISPINHPIWNFLLWIMPTVLMFIAFLLLIMLVPSTRIRPQFAMAGSAIGVAFWELAKFAFVNGTNYVIRASIMYGSMAAVIIFLFWLYIVWIIILAASEFTFSLQNRNRPWSGKGVDEIAPSGRVYLGLRIFLLISEQFHNKKSPLSQGQLANKMGLSLKDVEFLCNLFIHEGYLLTVGKDDWNMVPGGSLDTIEMAELTKVLIGGWPDDNSVQGSLADLLRVIDSGVASSIGKMSVRDYIQAKEDKKNPPN